MYLYINTSAYIKRTRNDSSLLFISIDTYVHAHTYVVSCPILRILEARMCQNRKMLKFAACIDTYTHACIHITVSFEQLRF
jgi:hypothetical protein